MQILAGVIALALLWWFAKGYIAANPARLSKYVKQAGGLAALVLGAVLLLKGRMDAAVPLAGLGAWLLGLKIPVWPWYMPGHNSGADPSFGAGGSAPLRSATLDMVRNPSSGQITGQVLEGPYAGRDLDAMVREDVFALAAYLARVDEKGLYLLQSYLDGRFPGWRETADGHSYARARRPPETGAMTEKEAYEVLGLQMGANEEDIRKAHRALMKKLHPDQGGSTYLATRVNMAKDVLLQSRH